MPFLIRTPVILIISALMFWAAGFAGFCLHILTQPLPDHARTEAIVVLTGGPDRINTGLDLLAEGKADYLFISGVNEQVTVEKILAMWRPEVEQPPCCIIIGHEAHNTYQNATEARNWIANNNIHSVRLITTDYHMPRARLEFWSVLPDIDIHPYPVKALRHNWALILDEYNKSLFTLFRVMTFQKNVAGAS